MKNTIYLDGLRIKTEMDFHNEISKALEFPDYYGKNLDALWDCLYRWIDTDIRIVWRDHSISKKGMGEIFDIVISQFEDLRQKHPEFEYSLE